MSMTIKTLKEVINNYPDDYQVKFHINDVSYSIEAEGDSSFNKTFFLFGNKEVKRELTKEQMLEQLNKLITKVNEDTNETFIV